MIINQGTIISNRYEILNKIGSGGMAIVYKARDLKLNRIVTVKVLREEFIDDEEFINKFNAEAQSVARLSNINIVDIYDIGEDEKIHYLIMEFVDGATLNEVIKKNKKLSNEEIIEISLQIAKGLNHAHSNNIVHRDIKPENILLTKKGVIKVADFGIAQIASSATVSADTTMGSVYYFSPEQARGGYVDHKSDIYSLGIVMFEMATGKPPFDGENGVAIALKHLNEDAPNVKDINPNISTSIANIIKKATEKKSVNRYANINLLVEDLEKALSDESGGFVNNEQFDSEKTRQLSKEELKKIKKINEENSKANYFKKSITKAIVSGAVTGVLLISILMFREIKKVSALKPVLFEKPEITNISLEEAKSVTSKLGIIIDSTTHEFSETVPQGEVISADFGNLEQLYSGCKVRLLVSSGQQLTTVPDFKGLTREEAVEQINTEQIELEYTGKDTYEFDDIVLENKIISQSPKPDEIVPKGTPIEFVISKGKKPVVVKVPQFVGMMESEAKTLAEELSIVLKIMYSTSSQHSKGTVITQTRRAFSEIEAGEEVSIIVSSGTALENTNSPNQQEAPVLKTKSLVLDFSNIDSESMQIKVYAVKASTGNATVSFEKKLSKNEFPYTLQVSGEGVINYNVYLVNEDGSEKLIATESIDFAE